MKAVHADVRALVNAGLVEDTGNGVRFGYDAVRVQFTLQAARRLRLPRRQDRGARWDGSGITPAARTLVDGLDNATLVRTLLRTQIGTPAMEINARDARQRFSELLDLAESGEEIIVTRHGKPAVRLVAERSGHVRQPLPDLDAFRTSIAMEGSLTEALIDERENERR